MSGGIISGMSAPETKNPSSIPSPFFEANTNSHPRPTTIVTTKMGKSLMIPCANLRFQPLKNSVYCPNAKKC